MEVKLSFILLWILSSLKIGVLLFNVSYIETFTVLLSSYESFDDIYPDHFLLEVFFP